MQAAGKRQYKTGYREKTAKDIRKPFWHPALFSERFLKALSPFFSAGKAYTLPKKRRMRK